MNENEPRLLLPTSQLLSRRKFSLWYRQSTRPWPGRQLVKGRLHLYKSAGNSGYLCVSICPWRSHLLIWLCEMEMWNAPQQLQNAPCLITVNICLSPIENRIHFLYCDNTGVEHWSNLPTPAGPWVWPGTFCSPVFCCPASFLSA